MKIDRIRALSLRYASGEFVDIPTVPPPAEKPKGKKKKKDKPAAARMPKNEWLKKYNDHLLSGQWRDFRQSVIALRGHRCQRCGAIDVPLDLHHKHYKTLGNERLRDVRLLCRDCHKKHHKKW